MAFSIIGRRLQAAPNQRLLGSANAVLSRPAAFSELTGVSSSMLSVGQLRCDNCSARMRCMLIHTFCRQISSSVSRLVKENSDLGRHVGRKGQFWDLKHDPDADWKPKDDESDYEYAVYPDEHEHVSWSTWLRWLLITLMQSAGALALVGGVSSTVVSHGVAKSQVLSGAKEVMDTTLERVDEFDLFIETMVELAALIDAGLGTSPGQWSSPASVGESTAAAEAPAAGATDAASTDTPSAAQPDASSTNGPPPSSTTGGGASATRPRAWESNRSAEWLRRRSELYTLRFDKLGPMMREMGDLRERGVSPLAAVLGNPWAYVQLVVLAAHEEELYSSLHQCDMSTQRLGEWKSDVVAWVEGMSVENLPALLTQAQEAVRARHVGGAPGAAGAQ